MTRLEIATRIFQGMCAGDWQIQIPVGKTWADVTIPRAFELADKMMAYQTTAQFEHQDYIIPSGEKND